MKTLSIISVILTAGFLGWLYAAATSNGKIDMDEFSVPAFFYGLLMLAFGIISILKSGKIKKNKYG